MNQKGEGGRLPPFFCSIQWLFDEAGQAGHRTVGMELDGA